jgi:hypothetical protein
MRSTTRHMGVKPQEMAIEVAGGRLGGTLAVPEGAKGLILFAHGSASAPRRCCC